MSTITVFGNVARPELKDLRGGKQVFEFSLAENIKGRNGAPDETVWWRVTQWEGADVAAVWIEKGLRLRVTGAFRCRTYQDRDGNTKVSLEISAKDIERQERRELTNDEREHDRAKANAYKPADDSGELPF